MGSDDEQFFYSRYFFELLMIFDKFFMSGVVFLIWEVVLSNFKEQVIIYSDMFIVFLMFSLSIGDYIELVCVQFLGVNSDYFYLSGILLQQNVGGIRFFSGLFYFCLILEGNCNSCLLNVVYFIFDDNIFFLDFVGISEGNIYIEKMFKELVEELKLNYSKLKNGLNFNSKFDVFIISLRV